MAKKRTGTRARARAPHVPYQMNETEKRFMHSVAEPLLAAGAIRKYWFERLRFRFGIDGNATYTPDFVFVLEDGEFEVIDVKGPGGWEEDARVKMKACAAMYPEFHWRGYTERKGDRGTFDREDFN